MVRTHNLKQKNIYEFKSLFFNSALKVPLINSFCLQNVYHPLYHHCRDFLLSILLCLLFRGSCYPWYIVIIAAFACLYCYAYLISGCATRDAVIVAVFAHLYFIFASAYFPFRNCCAIMSEGWFFLNMIFS